MVEWLSDLISYAAAIIDSTTTARWVRNDFKTENVFCFVYFPADSLYTQIIQRKEYIYVCVDTVDAYPVLFTMCWTGDEVCDFSAVKVFSDGATHVMDEIYQGNLKKSRVN